MWSNWCERHLVRTPWPRHSAPSARAVGPHCTTLSFWPRRAVFVSGSEGNLDHLGWNRYHQQGFNGRVPPVGSCVRSRCLRLGRAADQERGWTEFGRERSMIYLTRETGGRFFPVASPETLLGLLCPDWRRVADPIPVGVLPSAQGRVRKIPQGPDRGGPCRSRGESAKRLLCAVRAARRPAAAQ